MAVSYKKLWKLLIDKDMKKKDLCAAAGISHASMAKLGKNENVTMDFIVSIKKGNLMYHTESTRIQKYVTPKRFMRRHRLCGKLILSVETISLFWSIMLSRVISFS